MVFKEYMLERRVMKMNTESNWKVRVQNHILNHKFSIIIKKLWIENSRILLNCIKELYSKDYDFKRIIIVAPKLSIKYDWTVQLEHNEAYKNIEYICAMGKAEKKIALFNNAASNRIILTNDEAISWMKEIEIDEKDVIVIDDLSRYRRNCSERYKNLKQACVKAGKIIAFSEILVPNTLKEIWDELYLVDNGQTFGITKHEFINRYFITKRIWINENIKVYVEPKENAINEIRNTIGDICVDIADSEEQKKLQKKQNIYVELSCEELSKYELMARELSLRKDQSGKITFNENVVIGKLLQLASGTVYDNNKNVIYFHDKKIDILKYLMKKYFGNNILIAYGYKHELVHIKEKIRSAISIEGREEIAMWNRGEIQLGLINYHMGGLRNDLSLGGNILIWFSMPWSYKLYKKTNARIFSVDKESVVLNLVALKTVDEMVIRVLNDKQRQSEYLQDNIGL